MIYSVMKTYIFSAEYFSVGPEELYEGHRGGTKQTSQQHNEGATKTK